MKHPEYNTLNKRLFSVNNINYANLNKNKYYSFVKIE